MADFDKEIHEETSLSLKERGEEFLENVSIKWQEFLSWSEDKGLPFKKINDFFEEKGIPALPAMLLIVVLLVGGTYLAYLSATGPLTKTFTITVRDAEGNPVTGAAVQLQFSSGANGLQTKTSQTDSDGRVVFDNVPSTRASVSVTASDYQPASKDAEVGQGEDKKLVSISLVRIDNPQVTLSVTIAGPTSADVSLVAANSSILEQRNGTVSLAQFQVDPNSNYTIIARSTGFRQELKIVQIGTSNINIPIRMFRDGEQRTAPVYVRVYREDGTAPIANATVKLLGEATGAILATSETDETGASLPMELPVGSNVSISVSKEDFLTGFHSTLTVAEPEVSATITLVPRTAENSKNIVITVNGEDGRAISEPHIALFCGVQQESKDPQNGVAGFDIALGKTCLVSVTKAGFLPSQKELTSAIEQVFILHQATNANSGTVTVETVDKAGNSIAGVDVSVSLQDKKLGITKQTGVDGLAKFEYLPITNVTFTAANAEQEGQITTNVEPTNVTGVDGKSVVIRLTAAKATINVQVVDHFSRAILSNALVQLTDETRNTTSCTIANTNINANTPNSCSVVIQSGQTSAVVSVPGYESLSSEFVANPGQNNQSFELISSEVADDTELVFVGVFNDQNQRVSVLSPATRYTAKYILKAPSIDFTSASAFIQVGEADVTDLTNGAAKITSFSASGARSLIGGVDYSAADSFSQATTSGSLRLVAEDGHRVQPTDVLSSGDLSPLSTAGGSGSTSGTSASVTSGEFKWAQFTFDHFQGTKELKLVIQTNPVQDANVELFHRTEYGLALENGSTETFRNPLDAQAGKDKAPLLAQLSEPNVIPIHFEGKCVENMCLELWFEGASGKTSAFKPFEAVVPETFKLSYRVLAPPAPLQSQSQLSGSTNSKVTLTLQTDSDAIVFGINQSATQSTISRQVDIGEEGFFSLKATKYSNDVPISFTATGPSSIEEELHLSVSNAGNQLKVTTEPSASINAFEATTVKFTVTDNFGALISGARIVLQKGETLTAQVEAQEESPGKYTAEITPILFGQLMYTVQASAFKTKQGKLTVVAKNLVSIDPTSGLAVTIDSLEETSEGSSLTITNLIPNKEVNVLLSSQPNVAPKYSIISLSESSFKLKGGQSKTVTLRGKLKDSVIPFALKPATLKENYSGKVSITAKFAGGQSQTTSVNFAASAIIQQQTLAQLVDYSADSLEFSLEMPRKRTDSATLRITNNAPKAILINQQSDLPGIHVTPTSATIPPKGTFEFNVTASPSPLILAEQCVFDNLEDKGSIEFIASFQGMTVSKNVVVDVQASSQQRCIIPNAQVVTLPMDVNFIFPPGTIASKTTAFDGSQAVKLPNQELLVFTQGSQVTDQRAYVPAGSSIELGPQYVLQTSPTDFQVRFPVHATIGVPPQAQQSTLSDGSIRLSTQVVEITLPAGLQPGFQGGTTFATQDRNYDQFNSFNGFNNQNEYQRFGSFFGTQTSYALPAGTPIKISQINGAAGGEPFEIKYEDEMFIDLPGDTQARQMGSGVNVLLPSCIQLQVYSKGEKTQQVRDTLPASRQLSITEATTSGRTIRISPGGTVTLQPCLDADEDSKQFRTRLLAPLTFVLAPGTPDPRKTAMQSSYPNCAELVYRGGYSLGISQAKKIYFPQSAKVKDELENGAREIEVASQETIGFIPCKSVSASVSTFGGLGIEARTENGEPLTFTFTEADIGNGKTKESQIICLINKRKQVVSPVGDSYISLVEGSEAQGANLKLKLVKTQAGFDLSTSPKGECNNQFTITATIPQSVHDGKCIIAPNENGFEGRVKFTAKDSTDWTGSTSLPIKIIVKNGKQCEREHEKQANVLLRSFFIDYANDNVNDRTGAPFIFTFKGLGDNHVRVLTLLNNFESPLSIEQSGTPALNCNFPPTIAKGSAVAVRCTPRSATSGTEQLKIKATSGDVTFEKTINVVVYVGKPDVYQNSPWGELAPASPASTQSAQSPPSTSKVAASPVSTSGFQASEADKPMSLVSFAADDVIGKTSTISATAGTGAAAGFIGQCSKHYCTYDQAKQAFDNFLNELTLIADQKTATPEIQQNFCGPNGPGGDYKKTIVIHLANTKQDFAAYVNQPTVSTSSRIAYETINPPTLRGCGVYEISAKLDLCSGTALGTAVDRRQNSKIQIITAQKIAECPNNLANAPLFLGAKEDDLNVYLGRELGLTFNSPHKLADAIGILSLGPYSNSQNSRDRQTSEALLKTIYGEQTPQITPVMPIKYNNPTFCVKRGAEQIGIIGVGGVGIAGAIAATGLGAGFGARLAYGATQAGIACGLTIAGQSTALLLPGEQDLVCPAINGCIRSAILGAISTGLPISGTAPTTAAEGFNAARPSAGGAVALAGITIGSTVGAEAYNAYSEGPDISPGLAGPTAYAGASTLGNAIASSSIKLSPTEQYAAVRGAHPQLAGLFDITGNNEFILELLIDEEKSYPGASAFSKVPGSAAADDIYAATVLTGTPYSPEARRALQAKLNEFTGFKPGIKAIAATEQMKTIVKDNDVLDEMYQAFALQKDEVGIAKQARDILQTAVKGKTPAQLELIYSDSVKTFAKTAGPAGAPVVLTDSAVSTHALAQAEKSAVDAAKTAIKTTAPSRAARFGKALGPVAVQILAQLALDVDVRPTEIRVPQDAKNVVAIYHIEDPLTATNLPSIYKMCLQDLNGECSEKSFYLANVCDSDKDACILSHDSATSGADSYFLFVVINNNRIAPQPLFDSIMFPEAQPLTLTGEYKFGSIQSSELESLKQNDADQGGETALSRGSGTSGGSSNEKSIGGSHG